MAAAPGLGSPSRARSSSDAYSCWPVCVLKSTRKTLRVPVCVCVCSRVCVCGGGVGWSYIHDHER